MVGVTRIILPAEVLQQDACVIDEQPNHLVLSIRVPKRVILANKELMAAMIDLCGGEMKRPEPLEIVPIGRSHRADVAAVIFSAALALSLLLPWAHFHDPDGGAVHASTRHAVPATNIITRRLI